MYMSKDATGMEPYDLTKPAVHVPQISTKIFKDGDAREDGQGQHYSGLKFLFKVNAIPIF